jgi:hypothetical protein
LAFAAGRSRLLNRPPIHFPSDWREDVRAIAGDSPVWIPGEDKTFGFHRRDIGRAIAQGLTFRPLPLTAADFLPGAKKG